jgi:hypothetical protein
MAEDNSDGCKAGGDDEEDDDRQIICEHQTLRDIAFDQPRECVKFITSPYQRQREISKFQLPGSKIPKLVRHAGNVTCYFITLAA